MAKEAKAKAPKAPKAPKEAKPKAPKVPRILGHEYSERIQMGSDKNGPYGKDNNPKRGNAAKRFELYKDGITIQKALDAGVKRADIAWDLKQKFIRIAA